MGEVKQINDEYYIEFFARGLKYQQKAGSDRAKAEELLRTTEEKIAKGEAALIVRDVDIDIFFHDFNEYAAKTYTPKTLKRFCSTGGHFFSFLKSQLPSIEKLSQLTPKVVEQYKAYLLKLTGASGNKIKPKVVNATLLLLKDIFEYARKLGFLNDNPAIHTPLLKVKTGPRKLFSETDFHKILPHIPSEMIFAVEIILHSGMTLQEAVSLKWRDVDLERRTIRLENKDGSGFTRSARSIPIHPKLFETLTTLNQKGAKPDSCVLLDRNGHPFSQDRFFTGLRQIADENNLKETLNISSLVQSFAQSLVKRGVPVATLQKILGHDDILKTLVCSRLLFG